MVALMAEEGPMSETRKHRSFTPEQKIEIVLAGLGGDRPVRDVWRAMRSARRCIASGASGCWRAAKPRSERRGIIRGFWRPGGTVPSPARASSVMAATAGMPVTELFALMIATSSGGGAGQVAHPSQR